MPPAKGARGLEDCSKKKDRTDMSLAAMTWAWEQDLEPANKIILLAVADIADEEGIAFPSVEYLAKRCHMSERSVVRHVNELVEFKLLIREHRPNKPNVLVLPLSILEVSDCHLPLFEQFWNLYPRKVGKKPASQKWQKLKLDQVGHRIIEDVKIRKDRDAQWKRGFIPHPTTYLNQERWNDEIQEIHNRDAASIARKWREQRDDFLHGDLLDVPNRLTHH
jgi:hypothetical protein